MAKLLSVVETPTYLSKASKLMNLTNEQRIRLAAVANALLADFGGRR